MEPYRYFLPTEVVFGDGVLDDAGKYGARLGTKPLLVIGSSAARKQGWLDRVLAVLPDAVLFEGVEENPLSATCDRGAQVCGESGCDYVIALGGGSPMDAAKAIAGLACNPGACADYYGMNTFKQGVLPLMAIPTTSGTGSEVTPYSVLVDSERNIKQTIAGRDLFPRVALMDPVLTHSMPRSVTVATGLDALSQAMEGMLSSKSTPVGDALALDAARMVYEWLPVAAEEPENAEARAQMLHAAMLTGMVIAQSGTTVVHGMGYYYTTEFGVAHGLANALLLTPVFQHNAKVEPRKVAALAEAMGVPCEPEPKAAAQAVAAALHAFLRRLDVSPAAKDAGVKEDALADFAKEVAGNPRRLRTQRGELTEADVLALYQASYEGAA